MIEKLKCIAIKALVERFTGIPDIGVVCRFPEISDAKKMYCKLCLTKTNAKLRTVSEVLRLGYNHSSVIFASRKFDDLFPNIINVSAYNDIVKMINENSDYYLEFDKNQTKLYADFLDWFRKEVKIDLCVPSVFFVHKFFNNKGKN